MENNIDQQSRKNIAEEWLKQNLQCLRNLENYERLMREGVTNILEYADVPIQLSDEEINQVRIKNMSMMISEFGIILNNLGKIIEGNQLKAMKTKLDVSKKYYQGKMSYPPNKKKHGENAGKPIPVYSIVSNHITKKQKYNLSPMFFIIEDKLCELRGILISNLNHILFSLNIEEEQTIER